MVDYTSPYVNLKLNSLYSQSESISTSRQYNSPRTIESILRQKYKQISSTSKENSTTINLSSPAAHLEYVLSKSRFTKRSTKSFNSSSPKFIPLQAYVSIKDLEKRLKNSYQEKKSPKNVLSKNLKRNESFEKNNASLEIIQKLRQEVRKKMCFLEPQEPPDFLEMNALDRNNYWLKAKKQKIEEQRKAKKDKELDGCTFRPVISSPRIKTPVNKRSESPNNSYLMQYEKKRNYRSNSTGRSYSRFILKNSNKIEDSVDSEN
ncbi:hypothetical protein SteCoe_36658 [Stentor coeruleus]|uniref:Uncharacterized protein n=1 Tax=Stentor coeruleus TaxID=5963 RepID=A0A1R2APL8_9CILI|nr:hypothetical protein SteCoe_36658 [Stentor coeruleus]